MSASAFLSCYDLNAGVEPRVCGICATRLPRLRLPHLTLKNPRLPVHSLFPYTSLSRFLSLGFSLFLSLTLPLSSSLSLSNIYILLYLWRGREFHGFRTFRHSDDLGECPRLHLGFPALSGRHVFYSMFKCILYWAGSLYLCMAECQ